MRGIWRDVSEAWQSTAVVVGNAVMLGLLAAAVAAAVLGD